MRVSAPRKPSESWRERNTTSVKRGLRIMRSDIHIQAIQNESKICEKVIVKVEGENKIKAYVGSAADLYYT